MVIRLLQSYRPVLLSRGYRRATKGLVVATGDSTAREIGDEPMQMHRKFPWLPIVVDGDRVRGIDYITSNIECGVVLMDDGYQHRSVSPGLSVLMCDYARPMWTDLPFPSGRLREPWLTRHRAGIVVINKCPSSLSVAEAEAIERNMRLRPSQSIYFTAMKYGELTGCDGGSAEGRPVEVIAVAGIGRPEPFFAEVKRRFGSEVKTIAFPDHRNFTPADVAAIQQMVDNCHGNAMVITTEKDYVRFPRIENAQVCYIGIELDVLFDKKKELEQKLVSYVEEN